MSAAPPAAIRVDKWLWFARFFKTRTLAAKQVSEGSVRVNGTRISKPAATVIAGDVLTFAQGRDIRMVEIRATGERRGPAAEAQTLYSDRSPPSPSGEPQAPRYDRGGRPSKKYRRAMDRGPLSKG